VVCRLLLQRIYDRRRAAASPPIVCRSLQLGLLHQCLGLSHTQLMPRLTCKRIGGCVAGDVDFCLPNGPRFVGVDVKLAAIRKVLAMHTIRFSELEAWLAEFEHKMESSFAKRCIQAGRDPDAPAFKSIGRPGGPSRPFRYTTETLPYCIASAQV
jgi:hypothetical protein